MELQLKERLVGAVVLVVVSVIVIPLILDGPDRGLRTTRSMDLPPESSASGDTNKTFRLSLTNDQSTSSATQDNAANKGRAGPTTTTGPATAKTTLPVSGSPGLAGSGWTVQAGSFSRPENARTLVGNLKSQGFEAYINEHDSDGKHQFRVRVGQFETRNDADALAIRIRGETGEPARPVQIAD